jgi:AcrR family transcriptional regulator
MDDIAREMSVSKKTLYLYYADKKAMVNDSLKTWMDEEQKLMGAIQANAENAIEEIISLTAHLKKLFADVNPVLLFDMRKYYPEAWQYFQQHKEECYVQNIQRNLHWGIREGIYRKDINVDILAKMRIEIAEMAFDPKIFPSDKFSFAEVQLQFLDHFVHGIVTLKGYSLLLKYKQKYYTEIENP